MSEAHGADGGATVVRFRTGAIFVGLFIMAATVVFFLIAAFDPGMDFAGSNARHAELFHLLAEIRIVGVSVPFLLLAIYLIYVSFDFARRGIDDVAVRFDGEMLAFHPTVSRHPVPAGSIVSAETLAYTLRTDLRVAFADAPSQLVKNVEREQAEAFVARLNAINRKRTGPRG